MTKQQLSFKIPDRYRPSNSPHRTTRGHIFIIHRDSTALSGARSNPLLKERWRRFAPPPRPMLSPLGRPIALRQGQKTRGVPRGCVLLGGEYKLRPDDSTVKVRRFRSIFHLLE